MPQFNENVWFRKGLRGQGWVTPEYFGARGLPGVDDSVAFQAANDALANVSGGTVLLGPKQYRTDQTIHFEPNVSWKGVPDATMWRNNHATRNHHDWVSGSPRSNYTLVENIIFGALIGNTGIPVFSSGAARVHYKNCSWNAPGYDDNFTGRLVNMQGANSDFIFEKCHVYQKSTGGTGEAFFNSGADSKLRLIDNYIHQGPSTTAPVLSMVAGASFIEGNRFDAIDHVGNENVISVLDIVGQHEIVGNTFESAFSSGKALSFIDGAFITERDNNFRLINMYSNNLLDPSGSLSLGRALYSTTSSASITCANGFQSQSISSSGTAPTITMPFILFPGQEFVLTVYNNSGGSWVGINFVDGFGGTAGTTSAGFARTFLWKAVSALADGNYIWMCIGSFSAAFVP